MYDLPSKTLYTYLNNPVLDKFSFAHVSCSELAKEIDAYEKKGKSMPTPEEQALMFYMMNHGFHLIQAKYTAFETLPDDVAALVEEHMKITNDIAKRLFFYIILISIEEAHFMHEQAPHFHVYMEQTYGADFAEYVKSNCGSRSDLKSFRKLSLAAGPFLRGVRSVFDFGKWQGGFGGKPWGNIVGLASSVAFGRESFEMMTDYAFSLCHNNGSMFNKGKLYSHYTQFIYEILDIQASGQIPNWINENKTNKFVSKKLLDMHTKFAKLFPEEFTAKLDKAKVVNSGKVRKEKEKQHMANLNANNPAWGGGYGNNAQKAPPEPPKAKIDAILIDNFKNRKLI